MIKRFYSKRSGFTLVEIVVAFAVFAIMASMIMQILDLSVKARMKNNAYQQELDHQEHLLTLVEKNSENYTDSKGTIKVTFDDGTVAELPYDRHSAKADAETDADGLNYFLSPVNYQSDGEVTPNINPGDLVGSNTGSQASRMDTRITGTGGIANIQIVSVVKDTHTYAAGDPNAIPAGHTRYFIQCSASAGSMPQTLKQEDVPYSQYRLYFYCNADPSDPSDKSYLDGAASSVEYVDKDGNKYTKEVPKAAVITKVGYLKSFSKESLISNGLQTSDIISEPGPNNKYTIDKMGSNVVRIGSPFTPNNEIDGGLGNKGVRFSAGSTSKFYVEFVGDPHITVNSFGHNASAGASAGSAKYEACPNYLEEFDSSGNPEYNYDDDAHVNIYGAFLHKRNYK